MPIRPKPKRIDVMLSSTSKDLPTHREQATQAVLRVGMYPHIMETLTASLDDAISISLKLVDQAEIYIGIFGMRYGYIPDDPKRNSERISITEMEYRHAMQRGIPVLIFLMDDAHPGPKTAAEGKTFYEPSDEGEKKLKALKDELGTKHVVGFFKSPEDLRAHIIQALSDPEVVAKAQAFATPDDDEPDKPATPLPVPPDLYADPPYTLTSTFIGRTDELRRLDAWAKSADSLMIVEAIGGMGKSAVTWEWVNQRARDVLKPDGIVWWSFYESGATMTAFVRHALAYLTGQHPDALKGHDLKTNFRQLQHELHQGRYLLVLDGLERVLVAYHRWNAAQMRDDKIEDAESIIKDRDIRTCTDPKDDDLLRGLLACHATKILLSSRLIPAALEDRLTGRLSLGVAHIHLNGLHPDDALALVRGIGVSVENEITFKLFMKGFGYHSLLVKLVAGRILKFRRARGDFDAWYTTEGRDLHVSDPDLKQNQTHVLQYAFDGLDEVARRFLSQIAAFWDAVPYKTLVVFNPFTRSAPEPVKKPSHSGFLGLEWQQNRAKSEKEKQKYRALINEDNAPYEAYLKAQAEYEHYLKPTEYRKALTQFDALLSELEERGLLRWESDRDTYDMHPVVRGYAFDQLEGETKTATFTRIRGYFEAQPPEDVTNAKEISDLTNTIAIYRALVGARQWDEAAEFFESHLCDRLIDNIAAYYTVIELLIPLFPYGTDTLPWLSNPRTQSSIIGVLASMFYYVGQIDSSLTLEGLGLKLDLAQGDLSNLMIGLRNYALSLEDTNQLALAQRVLEMVLVLAQATEDKSEIIESTLYLFGIYKDTGVWEQFDAAYTFLQANPPSEVYWQAAVEQSYAESLLYRGRMAEAETALNRAEALAIKSNNAVGIRQIKGWRGEIALQTGDIDAAVRWFEECVQLSRKAGAGDVKFPLGGLARAYALKGDADRAHEIIATNGFTDKEIINVAEVYLILGEHNQAREYAIRAYKIAWADGPPYSWWWYLERAKQVLDALGEPYPDMPPYNSAKIGKFPYQDEIEAVIERERAKRKPDNG